MEGNRDRRAGV